MTKSSRCLPAIVSLKIALCNGFGKTAVFDAPPKRLFVHELFLLLGCGYHDQFYGFWEYGFYFGADPKALSQETAKGYPCH